MLKHAEAERNVLKEQIARHTKVLRSDLNSRMRQPEELVQAIASRLEAPYKHETQLRAVFQNLWVRATCDQLFYTLPRELRDVVYVHLLDDAESFCVGGSELTSDPGGVKWTLVNYWEPCKKDSYEVASLGYSAFRELVQT
jgi:hypothetical protein